MENIPAIASVLIFGGILIIVILIIRALGAWMLRINEVIDELKKINNTLNR